MCAFLWEAMLPSLGWLLIVKALNVALLLLWSHLNSCPVVRQPFNQLLYSNMGYWVEAAEVLQV